MLDDAIKAQLKTYMERLEGPIELVAALDESAGGAEMRALLADLEGLSPNLTRRHGGEPPAEVRRPSFGIARRGEAPRGTSSRLSSWPCCRSAATRPRSRPRSSRPPAGCRGRCTS
jgi:alkyl hydroperoxide reductase subunit AhpF